MTSDPADRAGAILDIDLGAIVDNWRLLAAMAAPAACAAVVKANGYGLGAAAVAQLPGIPASLAASSGIFLGPEYHFDLVRPGAALYGVNPQPGRRNPMRPVVRLFGKILQIRQIDSGESVGYGAAHVMPVPGR